MKDAIARILCINVQEREVIITEIVHFVLWSSGTTGYEQFYFLHLLLNRAYVLLFLRIHWSYSWCSSTRIWKSWTSEITKTILQIKKRKVTKCIPLRMLKKMVSDSIVLGINLRWSIDWAHSRHLKVFPIKRVQLINNIFLLMWLMWATSVCLSMISITFHARLPGWLDVLEWFKLI